MRTAKIFTAASQATLGLFLAACLASGTEPDKATSDDLSILYSARLFGYFRSPDVQTVATNGCPTDPSLLSPAAKLYLEKIGTRAPKELRVAMGDNFSPELLSRKLYDDQLHPEEPPSFRLRDLYTPVFDEKSKSWRWGTDDDPQSQPEHDHALQQVVPSDNVACFLRSAGFQAVVPGKDDFYFGPERLAQIANFLAQPLPKLPTVEMLGANITVVTTERNAPKPKPIDDLPKEIAMVLKTRNDVSISIPSDVLPWMKSVDVAIHRDGAVPQPEAYLCSAAQTDPLKFDTRPRKNPSSASSHCKASAPQPLPDKPNSWRYILPNDAAFYPVPGLNYAFCLILDPNPKDPDQKADSCKTFTVRQPLFQVSNFDPTAHDDHRPPYSNTHHPPYFFDRENKVVVFGVVDSALNQQIGLLNYSWLNDSNKKYDTQVKIIDPAEALQQVIQLCEDDNECKTARHILLAQMAADKARSLAAQLLEVQTKDVPPDEAPSKGSTPEKFRFNLILTQADEENFTGTASLSKPDPSQANNGPSPSVPFFLMPAYQYRSDSKSKQLNIRIQHAKLGYVNRQSGQWVSLDNTVDELPVSTPSSSAANTTFAEFQETIQKRVQGTTSQSTNPEKDPYIILALQQMQNACNADLALMQSRDVFSGPEATAAIKLWPAGDDPKAAKLRTDENYLDETFWKGDFAICRTITGASLKKALQQSKSLGPKSPLGLKYIGIDPDEVHATYFIHGLQLDEKKLYSMAVTDFLAFGDTQYADLASPDLPPPDSIRSLKSFHPISSLVAAILPNQTPCVHPKQKTCAETLTTDEYFDHIEQVPAITSKFFAAEGLQLEDWARHWIKPYNNTPTIFPFSQKKDAQLIATINANAQHRGQWFLNVEKLSTSYSLTTINGPEQLVNSRFGSITDIAQLQNTEQLGVSTWARARFGHEFSLVGDWYTLAEGRYGFKRQRKTSTISSQKVNSGAIEGYQDPYTTSVQENTDQIESGFLSKRISNLIPVKFLIAERFLSQIRRPLVSYTAPYVASAVAPTDSIYNCNSSSSDIKLPVVAGASSASILCTAPRSYLQETKVGVRLENVNNWLEIGYDFGNDFRSTGDAIFDANDKNQLICPANSGLSLTDCITQASAAASAKGQTLAINQLSTLYIRHRTLPITGGFLNFKVVVPVVADKIQFSIENYSEFFTKRAVDNATDTRFYQDAVVALPIKLGQNFSLSPQVEVFNYQNKVVPNHFLSLASQLTLDYNFAWHTGVRWSKALTYPYPSAVTKSAATPAQ